MASQHEYINYGLSEVKELFDTCIIQAVVIQVNHENNTADIETETYGRVDGVPIFYHCEGQTTVDKGHTAFYEDDGVDVLCVNARGYVGVPQMKVVGFSSGELKRCIPDCYVVFTVHNNITEDETCIVWNITKNLPAQIDGVTFPCAPSAIEEWRSSLYSTNHYNQLYDYPSDDPNDFEYGRGWSMTDNFPDFSASCDITEAQRDAILSNAAYSDSEVYNHPTIKYCGNTALSHVGRGMGMGGGRHCKHKPSVFLCCDVFYCLARQNLRKSHLLSLELRIKRIEIAKICNSTWEKRRLAPRWFWRLVFI